MRGVHLFGRRDERPPVALICACTVAAINAPLSRSTVGLACASPMPDRPSFSRSSRHDGCDWLTFCSKLHLPLACQDFPRRRRDPRRSGEARQIRLVGVPVSRRTPLGGAALPSNVVTSIAIIQSFKHTGGRQALQDRPLASFHPGDLTKSY